VQVSATKKDEAVAGKESCQMCLLIAEFLRIKIVSLAGHRSASSAGKVVVEWKDRSNGSNSGVR
jgi:hypothetical protein